MISQASLSIIWILGSCPAVVSTSISFFTPLLMHVPNMGERAYAKMALLS